jgi:hypothetical protein
MHSERRRGRVAPKIIKLYKKFRLHTRTCTRPYFNTKTARKWHIDCMESEDSPALRKKGVKVVHVKQRKAGRILF